MDIGTFFTRQGPGGLIALIALTVCLVAYGLLIRWIAKGSQEEKEPWEQLGWPFE